MKKHPVTGEDAPDETARVPLLSYVNPRPAEWPESDFIVGNPPFIGNKRMREAIGHDYSEALRATYPDVPESADFVMYLVAQSRASRARGKSRALRFHHHEQPAADIQPPRRRAPFARR